MYRVAICDDEEKELDITESLLAEYLESLHSRAFIPGQDVFKQPDIFVDRFTSAEELCIQISMGRYRPDLLFFDIYMEGKSGMEAALELRREGFCGPIIFLTTSKDHALEAFGAGASMYLVKPLEKQAFFSALDKALEEVERERRRCLILRIDGKLERIVMDDIVYCEAEGNYQGLHLQDETVQSVRMTMTELYGLLTVQEGFVRAGSSYIINLNKVDSLNSREIVFSTGRRLHLPRGVYSDLKEQYFRFYCGRQDTI